MKIPSYNANVEERAILSLSCGKDSLLSLGVCDEIGLNPISIYINDTVSPPENKIKTKFVKKIAKEFGFKFFIVKNEIEKLNDFEFWDKDESCIGYTHMVTGFCFISLPFSHYYKAKYIVVGNQQNMNFKFCNKNGFLTYPAFDQTRRWMKQQDIMIKIMTSGKVSVMSVIEPLTNIAIVRILHKRYEKLGKYEVSCDCLDASLEKRWCHNCSKCARLSLLMRANGISLERVGFKRNLLDKKHKNLYCLFDGKEIDCYEKSREARDEQLLAFYMAYRNNQRGYLIDLFKKKFLEEAKSREDHLFKKFFSIHKSITMPKKIEKRVLSIFREELKDLS
jgi:7-cyano-7-deazaguanine synthase in queuosine biosynthesis